MFAEFSGDRGSIPCRITPKTKKWYLILLTEPSTLKIKDKVEPSREWSNALHYSRSYRKGSLRVTLDWGSQLTYHNWEKRGVRAFPTGINPKINVITWLEFRSSTRIGLISNNPRRLICVVAIEKGAFGSPSTTVGNIYKYWIAIPETL